MKIRKKVLLAALAISLTSTPSLTKDFSAAKLVNNIAYASEASATETQAKPEGTTENTETKENTEIELTSEDLVNIHEYLLDKFEALQKETSIFDSLTHKEELTKAIETLKVEAELKDTDSDTEKAKKVSDQVNSNLTNLLQIKKESEDTNSELDLMGLLKEVETELDTKENEAEAEADKTLYKTYKEELKGIMDTLGLIKLESKTDEAGDSQDILVPAVNDKSSEEDKKLYKENLEAIDAYIKDKREKEEEKTAEEENSDLSTYKKVLEDAKNHKDTQAYYRASARKRGDFDKAYGELETYIKAVEDKTQTFDKAKADELSKKLTDAKNALDGLSYDSLLTDLKKKLEDNKNNLEEKDYKDLLDKYNGLTNKENLENTVDDINELSSAIDQKVAEYKKAHPDKKDSSTPTVQQETKKVAVPKANSGYTKQSKSIVRTGIDSVKAFGIVAVVAIVLLLVTRGKKDK